MPPRTDDAPTDYHIRSSNRRRGDEASFDDGSMSLWQKNLFAPFLLQVSYQRRFISLTRYAFGLLFRFEKDGWPTRPTVRETFHLFRVTVPGLHFIQRAGVQGSHRTTLDADGLLTLCPSIATHIALLHLRVLTPFQIEEPHKDKPPGMDSRSCPCPNRPLDLPGRRHPLCVL